MRCVREGNEIKLSARSLISRNKLLDMSSSARLVNALISFGKLFNLLP